MYKYPLWGRTNCVDKNKAIIFQGILYVGKLCFILSKTNSPTKVSFSSLALERSIGYRLKLFADSSQVKFRTATAIPFIYSFSGNSAASAPISTFMCLWAIYIFPRSFHIFPPAEQADPSWEYIICSQTHECGNWDWSPDIPFLGIFVSNFRHFVFAVRILRVSFLRSFMPVLRRFSYFGLTFPFFITKNVQ